MLNWNGHHLPAKPAHLPPAEPPLLAPGRAQHPPLPLISDDTLLSVADVVRLLGISRSLFYKLAAAGLLPASIKLGRRRLIPMAALRAWIANASL